MSDLVLGPLLRHVGHTDATVWGETDARCEVEVLGCISPTFRVGSHLYALVHVTGLEPGKAREYEVRLDEIYAHKPPFDTLEFIKERRGKEDPPGEVVADFEEYARIYHDAWTDPAIRWLLSTVPSAMIFDDHEVGDDWNISAAWVEEMRQQPYWNDQIIGGYASYWIYQHLGNLSPEELDRDDLYKRVRSADDGWLVLREFAYSAHRGPDGTRWSYHRDFGNIRLLMMDARGGRVLEEDRRSISLLPLLRPAGKATGPDSPRGVRSDR